VYLGLNAEGCLLARAAVLLSGERGEQKSVGDVRIWG